MQIAVVEYARNVSKLANANSTEFDRTTPYPVIAMITEWQDISGSIQKRNEHTSLGGTMRLGAQECKLMTDSLAHKVYKSNVLVERHRHRYEVNNALLDKLTSKGLVISGVSVGSEHLVEVVELPDHPWFLGCQFHPEFTSNPKHGHPLFISYIHAALKHREHRGQ
jgi:CTP synthase